MKFEDLKKKDELKLPRTLLIGSDAKTGKTTLMVGLQEFIEKNIKNGRLLHLSYDKGGADYVSGFHTVDVDIKNHDEVYKMVYDTCVETKKKFDFIVIDKINNLSDGINSVANQMAIKKFNAPPRKRDKMLPLNYDMTTYPNGYGWSRLRDEVLKIINDYARLTKYLIIFVDVKYTQIEENVIRTKQLALTGALSRIIPSQVDAIAFLKRKKGNENYLSFLEPKNNKVITGSRAKHLRGKEILISKMEDDKFEFYWEDVYLPKFL